MKNFKKRLLTASILFLTGCFFIVTGIHRGEQQTVENKSGIICLECIGIG